jgi:hypothetical protein
MSVPSGLRQDIPIIFRLSCETCPDQTRQAWAILEAGRSSRHAAQHKPV